jgi:tetratricopeptide (TPR) repeat protein
MERIENTLSDTESAAIVQAGVVNGNVSVSTAARHILPRQLPPATRHFVGREAELAVLSRLSADTAAGATAVCLVDGPPGIGKTALAVQWAHLVEDRFPDGQLYLDLHGFDGRRPPVKPADVARMALEALLGVGRPIPADIDAQAALLRSLTAGRRILLLIDNALSSGQVRAVLPGSPHCFTLVTSRERLDGLFVHHGAHRLNLAPLTDDEACRLIVSFLGPGQPADGRLVADLARRCAQMPLALSVAAAKAAADHHNVARLLEDLDEGRCALDTLLVPDLGDADVRLAFSLSYDALPRELSSVFRTLALHPGADIDISTVAAMTGAPIQQARRQIDELVRRNLLSPVAPGRVAFHDLLRAYGLEKVQRDGQSRQRTALRGLFNHYLHLAHRADRFLNAHRRPLPLITCKRADLLPSINSHDDAVQVFTIEYDNFIAATRLAQRGGWGGYAWQLPWVLSNYAYLTARWRDWIETHDQAASAARRARRTPAEARIRQSLGRAYSEHGSYGDACREYVAALSLLDGDDRGQANALNGLGGAHVRAGEYSRAVDCAERALALYERLDDAAGLGSTLNLLGRAISASEPHRAVDYHRRALQLFEHLGDDYGRAHSAGALGTVFAVLGTLDEAEKQLSSALSLHRAVGNRRHQAAISGHLAEVLITLGRMAEAAALQRDMVRILEEVGDQ